MTGDIGMGTGTEGGLPLGVCEVILYVGGMYGLGKDFEGFWRYRRMGKGEFCGLKMEV